MTCHWPFQETDTSLLRPELLRAEAVAALMQTTASQSVNRALLRKTRTQRDVSNLQAGQAVAFWRWSARSRQRKKGGWCLGRLLAHDPDKKTCWIQVGKTSLRVGATQLRSAVGWESWTPSTEDIELLKDARANIATGLWGDAIEDDPTQEQHVTADADLLEQHGAPNTPALWQDTHTWPSQRPQQNTLTQPLQQQ